MLAVEGVDPLELPLDRLLHLIEFVLLRNSDEKERAEITRSIYDDGAPAKDAEGKRPPAPPPGRPQDWEADTQMTAFKMLATQTAAVAPGGA